MRRGGQSAYKPAGRAEWMGRGGEGQRGGRGGMTWKGVFLGLTMLGFAFAFFSLFREDRDTEYSDFTNFWHAVVSMLSYLLAMFDYNIFYNSTNPVSAMLLFIVFEFVMNVMLLNIMIAVMTSSLSKATREEGHRFLLSRAALIDELEATLPRCLRRPAWSPPFIHLLKVKAACEAPAEGPEGRLSGPTLQQLEQALAAEAQAACARLESTHSQLLQCSAQLDQAAGALARIAWSRCAAG
ncbi:hypothetical protein QJQ45_015853 [Haematococcus lacustris]|nr:hypothetical protein QJQ45_015853 [Haematococcus lacustris]